MLAALLMPSGRDHAANRDQGVPKVNPPLIVLSATESQHRSLRTVFGTRLRLLFAIRSGLQCRGEKRDSVLDLLTGSALRVCESNGARYKRDGKP
jgi:hypothetical protein